MHEYLIFRLSARAKSFNIMGFIKWFNKQYRVCISKLKRIGNILAEVE